jgi:hypothetical protein
MHLKTVIFTLLLFLAGSLGRSQKVTLPFCGWVLWGGAISLALMGENVFGQVRVVCRVDGEHVSMSSALEKRPEQRVLQYSRSGHLKALMSASNWTLRVLSCLVTGGISRSIPSSS